MSSSSFDHSTCEELCALAAAGELDAAERVQLDAHLAICESCRQLYADFLLICSRELSLAAAAGEAAQSDSNDIAGDNDEAQAFYDRFQRRLKKERYTSSAPSRTHVTGRSWREWLLRPVPVGVMATCLAIATFLVGRYPVEKERRRVAAVEQSRLAALEAGSVADQKNAENASKQEELLRLLSESETARKRLELSMAEAELRRASLQVEHHNLVLALTEAKRRSEDLQRDVDVARAQSSQFSEKQKEVEARLRVSLAEIQRLRAAQLEAVNRANEQGAVLATLRRKLEATEVAADHAALAASGDAQASNLFGARDLHIVDVYDVDSKGNTKRSFGRVYYVEKTLLVFYAFDLHQKRRDGKAAFFQAWGYREAADRQPRSLGLFQADAGASNRWVLKVSNPQVLAHIDVIFVTLEPRPDRTTPSGHRLLYANLMGPPNHP